MEKLGAAINLRIDEHIKEALEREADRQDRSVGWLVRKILSDHVVALDLGEGGVVMKDGSAHLTNVQIRDGIGDVMIGGDYEVGSGHMTMVDPAVLVKSKIDRA